MMHEPGTAPRLIDAEQPRRRKPPSPRLTALLPWLALSAVWLLGLVVAIGLGTQSLTMVLQRRILGGTDLPVTACDIPNFCATTGATEVPVPLEAISRTTQLIPALSGIVLIAVVLTALALGTRVVRHISRGEAFAPAAVRSLGLTSAILLAGGALTYVLEEWGFNRATAEAVGYMNGLPISQGSIVAGHTPTYPSMAILFGLLGFAAWAAFRQGARMREELDGVI